MPTVISTLACLRGTSAMGCCAGFFMGTVCSSFGGPAHPIYGDQSEACGSVLGWFRCSVVMGLQPSQAISINPFERKPNSNAEHGHEHRKREQHGIVLWSEHSAEVLDDEPRAAKHQQASKHTGEIPGAEEQVSSQHGLGSVKPDKDVEDGSVELETKIRESSTSIGAEGRGEGGI